jgi:hypothetical protein
MCAYARILALEEVIDTEWVYMWDKFCGYILLLLGLTAKAERVQVTKKKKKSPELLTMHDRLGWTLFKWEKKKVRS